MNRFADDPGDSSQPDYVLDISGLNHPAPPHNAGAKSHTSAQGSTGGRPYLSIHFKCCNAYLRIYPTADGTAYAGHCPKCARPVRVKIGPGGSSQRVFEAE